MSIDGIDYSLPAGNAPNSCLLFKIDKFFNCNMILKKYDYFRIENVMFMMDNYDINTVYEKYMQLNKKERKRLLDSLHIHGIDIEKIEPYVYSEAPGIKHLFFYFRLASNFDVCYSESRFSAVSY